MLRAQIEQYAKCSILDMTWARVRLSLSAIPEMRRIERGLPMSHAERIERRKKQQATEL